MFSVALHKTFAYTHTFENELFLTTVVQQGKQVEVVGCHTSLAN
jgi:hypothetical protein